MTFSVFGGSGFIGRHLVQHLRQCGHETNVPSRGEWPDAETDLGHVVYAVGLTADFRTRPFETINAHVTLVSQLLEKARFASFTYLSSTRVYAGSASTDEDTPLQVEPSRPDEIYNISKLAGEAICLAQPLADVRVVRLSNVVGPDIAETDTFLGAICREARTGKVRLQSAATSRKDYIWINDVVTILTEIAQFGQKRTYNVAGGRQISHWDWAAAVSERTGCEIETNPEAVDSSFPPIQIERARREFGFNPQPVLERIGDIVGCDVGSRR